MQCTPEKLQGLCAIFFSKVTWKPNKLQPYEKPFQLFASHLNFFDFLQFLCNNFLGFQPFFQTHIFNHIRFFNHFFNHFSTTFSTILIFQMTHFLLNLQNLKYKQSSNISFNHQTVRFDLNRF